MDGSWRIADWSRARPVVMERFPPGEREEPSPMLFKNFRLFLLEQRLRLHSGKYEAYLNRIRQKGLERNNPARLRIAVDLLRQPEFSRVRCWAEYQRLRNSEQEQKGTNSEKNPQPRQQVRASRDRDTTAR